MIQPLPVRKDIDAGRRPTRNRGLHYPAPPCRMIGDVGNLYSLERRAESAIKAAAQELARILETIDVPSDLYKHALPESMLHFLGHFGDDVGIAAAVSKLTLHGWTVVPPAKL